MNYITNYNYNALMNLGGICFMVQHGYYFVDKYLQRFEKYNQLPDSKKKYVIKNFIKSTMLLLISTILAKPLTYPAIMHNQWNNRLIHLTGGLYTGNDLVGLIMVKDLPKSTKAHHIITTTLCLLSFGIDFQHSELGKMMFVYTLSSCNSYLVNFYLGARHIVEKTKIEYIRIYSRNIYFICCMMNWGWHLMWITNNYSIVNFGHMIYFILLFWIIKDDLILLSWLNNTMLRL